MSDLTSVHPLRRIARKTRRLLNGTYPRRRFRLILDCELANRPTKGQCTYRVDINKESLSRQYVLERHCSGRTNFLDVGGRDGKLKYLLGNAGPLDFDEALHAKNLKIFTERYTYFGIDLVPSGPQVLVGDICSSSYMQHHAEFRASFDVVYSNEVFEHLEKPWTAAENIYALMKKGGICITVVPFSQRHHDDPGDFFRYTPDGVISLFKSAGEIEILEKGYDIRARRYDWQGSGDDTCPRDHFGAWRETWYTVVVIRKPGGASGIVQ